MEPAGTAPLDGHLVRAAARRCGFALVGLARAEALDGDALDRWLSQGRAAGMTWMHERRAERLDPRQVLPGAATVIALGIPYHRPRDERSVIARYARGRDYHYTHRDRMKALRKALLALDAGIETYACVDTGPVMEKAWAERAGLGWIGKNGCLINRRLGSWVTLSVMFMDRAVDDYDQPHANHCGTCSACLTACPTQAIPEPGVVDAGLCVAYQSIENHDGDVPVPLRPALVGRAFGCDVCQDVCPYNRGDGSAGDPRQAPRPLGLMTAVELASLSRAQYDTLAPGTAMARVGYDGLRRNAVLALGPAEKTGLQALLEQLAADPAPTVAEAASWALGRRGPSS